MPNWYGETLRPVVSLINLTRGGGFGSPHNSGVSISSGSLSRLIAAN